MTARRILDVSNLEIQFEIFEGTVYAINGVNFHVKEGETLAVVGESGSGKSVTMLSLLRLLPEPPAKIAGGKAMFDLDGTRVNLLDLGRRQRRKVRGGQVALVAQDPLTSLNPTVKIGTQIVEAIHAHLDMSRRQARRRAIELLETVGIPDAANRIDDYPHQFSGGMRQRVMIAIAIAAEPRLLIADEPTTALDVTVQAQIVDLVRELRASLGLSVIWITHDLGVVAGMADRVVVMYGGMCIETAPVDEFYAQPLHPYSQGLLGALPKIGESRETLDSIPGLPPDLMNAPKHCPFAWRCPHAFDRCWEEIPPAYEPHPGRRVACFFDVEKGVPRDD